MFATIKKDFGSIDILVNNAGTLDHIAQIEHQNDELWDRDLRVNLSGAFNCTKAAWPYMREQGWGRVIYMASVAGTLGGFGQASYAATKASLVGFTRSLAREVGELGINVNAIAPGFIDTDMTRGLKEPDRKRVIARSPLRRLAEPEDVAAMSAFLMGEGGRNITGTVMTVDAGSTA